MAKLAANAFSETKRRGGDQSPTKFLQFKNARVVHLNKYLEEVTLAIDKPQMPDQSTSFEPSYFKLERDSVFGKCRQVEAELTKKQEKKRLKEVREFYQAKGIKDPALIEELILRG